MNKPFEPTSQAAQKKEFIISIIGSILIGLCISLFLVKKIIFLLPLVITLTIPILILVPLDYIVLVLVAVGVAIQAGLGVFFFRIAGIGTYPLEILLFLSLAILFIEILLKKRKLPAKSLFLWLFVPFLIYNLLVTVRSFSLLNEGRDISAIRVSIHNFLSYLAIYVFLAYFDKAEKIRAYFYASLVGILCMAIIIFSPVIPWIGALIPMMSRGRISMQNVGLLAFWYPVLFQYFSITNKRKERYAIGLVFAFSFVAFVLSQYRASWVGVSLSLFIAFIMNIFFQPKERRIRFVLRVVFLVIVGLIGGAIIFRFLLPREFAVVSTFLQKRVLSFKFLRYDPALLSRRVGVYESKEMFKDSPIFGRGFGITWTFVGHRVWHVDNLYWQALVQYGIFGSILFFVPFLVWGYQILYILLNLKKLNDPLIFSLAVGLISFYIPFFLMHLTMAHLIIAPAIIVITLSFIALTDYIYRELQTQNQQ